MYSIEQDIKVCGVVLCVACSGGRSDALRNSDRNCATTECQTNQMQYIN